VSVDARQVALSVLQGASAVTALVGNRISPLTRQQDAPLPAVTMLRIAVVPANNLLGNGNLDQTRLQIDCWGATATDASGVASAVRTAMEAAGILMMNQPSDAFQEAPNPGTYQIIQEYSVWS
jgi:hypothetical protein